MSRDPIRGRDQSPDPPETGAGMAGREMVLSNLRAAYHHELELARSATRLDSSGTGLERRLAVGEVSWRESERLSRPVNRLSRFIRGCGTLSIVLGAVAATFLWPRVRLPGLIACAGLGLATGLLGLGLRPLHRDWRHRLANRSRVAQRFSRTKAYRCRLGLGFCTILLATGLLIDRPRGTTTDLDVGAAVPTRRRGPEVDAGQDVRLGDLSLRIASGQLRHHHETAPRLELVLEARNVGTARKLDFDHVRDIELYLNRCSLWDSLANTYHRLERPDFDLEPGRDPHTALYPGESLRIRLVFERPVPRAQQLRLLVPSGSFGLPDAVLFRIDTAQLAKEGPH